MTNVQLDTDVMDRLRSEKISSRDTYNDVLRRTFKKLDNSKEYAKGHITLVDKDEIR